MMESWCLEWSVFVMTRADGVVECSVFSRGGQRRGSRVRRRGGSRSDGVFESSSVNINEGLVWGMGTVGWFSYVRVYGWCSYGSRFCSLLHRLG